MTAVNIKGRNCHWVFKIAQRGRAIIFFREILGMKILRHEEFADGCDAKCNGPYDTRWSKTMVGYGPEDNFFVFELVYNYTVRSYKLGNDFIGATIISRESLERAKAKSWPISGGNTVEAPGGYKFFLINEPQPTDKDPVQKITLPSSNLEKSIKYWTEILGLQVLNKNAENRTVILGYNRKEAGIELQQIDEPINHGTSFGRLALSCPYDQQHLVDEKARKENTKILIPLKSLDTPGKATVRVIILADPDGTEICMVDDEKFRELSEYKPDEEVILDRFIKKDETGQLKIEDDKRAKAEAAKAAAAKS